MKYSIGEFSRITCTSIKAFHLYHDQGLLIPDFVDPESGYRYYSDEQFYEVQVIGELKLLGFSLREIKGILDDCEDERDLIGLLNKKRVSLNDKIDLYQAAVSNIELIIEKEKYTMNSEERDSIIEEKHIPDMLIAGHRMCGKYSEVGKGFSLLGRAVGRHIKGPASCLYFDEGYKEEDADFEPFFEVKKEIEKEGVNCRNLPGARAVTLLHRGPYENLTDSYKILMDAIKEKELKVIRPSREVFLKGPGMIFKGDPKKYVTEIQFLLEAD